MADKYTSSLNLPDLETYGQAKEPEQLTGQDYVQDINVVSQLKDPRFIEDLRSYYQASGQRTRYLSNDEMIDKFFSDQTWELLNTGSAVMGAIEAQQAGAEQKQRMNRIQQVYNRLPNFYQEGGRGTWDMLQDAVPAVITDPLNLVPIAKGFASAGTAARLAATQGKNAMYAGVKQGAKTGALTEAAISGAQEGIINTAGQARDVSLGLRDEISQMETLGATAFGAGAGALTGGILGAGAGAFSARNANPNVSALRELGVDDGTIGQLTNEQAKQLLADPDGTRAQFAEEPDLLTDVEAAPIDPVEAAFNEKYGDTATKLNLVKSEAEDSVIRAMKDGVPESEINDLRKFRDAVNVLDGMKSRIMNEEEEIRALSQTADQGQLKENRARIVQFNRAQEQFRVLIETIDADADPDLISAQVEDLRKILGFTPKAEDIAADVEGLASDAAESVVGEAAEELETSAGAGDGTPSTVPEVVDGGPPPPDDSPTTEFTYTTAKVKGEIQDILAENSVDGDMLDEWINAGAIEAPEGKMSAKSKRQLSKQIEAMKSEDAQEITPSADTDEYLQSTSTALPEIRGWALSEGLDYRKLASDTRAKGLTKGPVRKAIAIAKDEGIAEDAYAVKAREELDDILNIAAAGNATDVDARNLVEMLSAGYQTNKDDLLALFDYTNNKTNTSESSMSMRLTKTEETFLKKRQRELKKEYPDASEDTLEAMANLELINRRTDGNQTPVRGTGESIEDASKFTTAGRNTAGRIQGQLRRGTRISKGSDYTVTGGNRVTPSTFGFEAALAEATTPPASPLKGNALKQAQGRTDKMIANGMDAERARKINGLDRAERGSAPGIVEYVTSKGEVINTANGRQVMKGGEVAYVDAVTKRSYESIEFLLRNRDGVSSKGVVKQTVETPDAVDIVEAPEAPVMPVSRSFEESMGDLIAELSDDPVALRKALIARAEELADTVANTSKKKATETPGKKGDMLIVVREKSDPSNIRMMSKKQADAGATAADVIGTRKPDPADWDIRYAPLTTPRGKASLTEIFDTLPANPDLDGSSGSIVTDGRVAAHVSLSPEDAAKTHWEASPRERQIMTFLKKGDKEKYTVSELWLGLKTAQNMRWRETSQGHEAVGEAIALLQAKYSELAPNGIRVGEEARAKAVSNIRELFSKYAPDEVDLAVKFIRGLGGDTAIGPAIKARTDGGNPMLTSQYDPATKTPEQDVLLNFGKYDEIPNISKLYHEVAHWAYEHILTPKDRAEFWNVAKEAYSPGAKQTYQKNKLSKYAQVNDGSAAPSQMETEFNFYESPQEFFAWQFDLWASRKKSGDLVQNEVFWRKIARYVENIFNRYANDAEIHPDLEPLFSKILPDSERAGIMMGRDATPSTTNAQHINARFMGIERAEADIEDAILRDSPEGIIEAHRVLVSEVLLSMAPKRGTESRPNTGVYGPVAAGGQGFRKGNLNIIRQRIQNIDEIVTGKPFKYEGLGQDLVGYKPAWLEEGMTVMDDPLPIADALRDFYLKGFASDNPAISDLTRPGGMKNLNASSVKAMIGFVKRSLETAYRNAEGGNPPSGTKIKPDGENSVRAKASTKTRGAKKKNARVKTALNKEAATVAKTPVNKRTRTEQKGSLDAATAPEIKTAQLADLHKMYVDHRGSERGDQIAIEIVTKTKAQPLPAEKVGVSREVLNSREPDIREQLMDALYEGDSDRISELTYELQRRATNKGLKKQGLATIDATVVNKAVQREVSDNMGVPSNDGIPASSRAAVREMLSFITHRDPEAQQTARTMTYRMINLMGKTVQGDLSETNILSSKDLVRLAGGDADKAPAASYADLRSPEFKKLRADMRRLSIGLTKGTTSPFDVVHEIGHMIVRSDVLDNVEMDAIREAYSASSDTIKNRIIASYGNKYNDFANKDDALVKEWFSETLAKYMGERVTRGNMLEAMANGDISKLKMRNSFDRAIDKMVEYVSYVVNGLVGRNDIKQQFRRMFLYGDMFERPSKSPLADVTKQRAALHPSIAAAATFDSFSSSPRPRMDNITKFVSTGISNGGNDRVIPFYHGTPNGYAFNKVDSPDVILRPSVRGFYGPGVYLANSPTVASEVFSRKPTPESMRSQIMEMPNLSDEVKEELIFDSIDLHEVRKSISKYRRKYYMAQASDMDAENLGALREILDDLVEMEESYLTNLTEAGIKSDPLVLPTYVRVKNPVDFQRGTIYHGGADPLVQAVLRHAEMTETTNQKAINALLAEFNEGGLDGPETYQALVSFYRQSGRNKLQAQNELNETLEDLGHDGILTTHDNTISVDGTDRMANTETYEGSSISYQGVVVFDPANVKHVEADDFDATDSSLYHRDVQPIARGDVGDIFTEMAINESIDSVRDLDAGLYGEILESNGVDTSTSSAIMSMMRGRTLSPKETQALQKGSSKGFLKTQSDRLDNVGMTWLGDWYKNFWPDQSQAFAQKYMPIEGMLNKLPDADGKLMRWARDNNPTKSRYQPASFKKIVKALRYGETSRPYNSLAPEEKKVAQAVRAAFRKELQDLRKAGVMIGDRGPNYMPHVWSKDKIVANPSEFKEAMAYYYKLEKTAMGADIPTKAEVNDFAEDMFLKLGTDEETGLYKPAMGGSKNPTSDHVDYSRVIELEKYPAAMQALEGFLEDDLRFLLIKYLEGTTRRLTYMEKLGQNSHGYTDYMTVLENGREGIGKLLSTNREFVVNRTAMGTSGPTEYQLSTTAFMPFEGDLAAGTEFADQLIRTYEQKGLSAAKEMLARVAPVNSDGTPSLAYSRRADAIMGALQDFGGQKARLKKDDVSFANDAMNLVMKKPTSNSGTEQSRNISKAFRATQNVTLLGFTTLSSLGDPALPLIRSGSMKAYAQGVYQLASDPDYARAIHDIGTSMENIIHERMIYMYGSPDNKMSQAFFNVTGLTPWTNTQRKLAGSVGFNSFKAMQTKASKNFNPSRPVNQQNTQYRTAHRYLTRYGLADFLPNGTRGKQAIDNELLTDRTVRTAVLRFTDETIFQPNPNDMPMSTNNPWMAMAFQLKSFPLMMQRLTGYVVDEARQGNFKPFLYMATVGPGMGAVALTAKDVLQFRGGEDGTEAQVRVRNIGELAELMGGDAKTYGDGSDFISWYTEGLLQMGGLGLMADIFHSTVQQVDNGAYGQTRIASSIMGPSFGMVFMDGGNVLGGLYDATPLGNQDSNAKERSGARAFASRIPFLGGIRAAREGIVDTVAGEATSRKSKFGSGLGGNGLGKGIGNK
tara:strand:+ start:33483 stop:43205 length:9723 start_codon:yes stop_codon:yes gene_type:complete